MDLNLKMHIWKKDILDKAKQLHVIVDEGDVICFDFSLMSNTQSSIMVNNCCICISASKYIQIWRNSE